MHVFTLALPKLLRESCRIGTALLFIIPSGSIGLWTWGDMRKDVIEEESMC